MNLHLRPFQIQGPPREERNTLLCRFCSFKPNNHAMVYQRVKKKWFRHLFIRISICWPKNWTKFHYLIRASMVLVNFFGNNIRDAPGGFVLILNFFHEIENARP